MARNRSRPKVDVFTLPGSEARVVMCGCGWSSGARVPLNEAWKAFDAHCVMLHPQRQAIPVPEHSGHLRVSVRGGGSVRA
jgi:hypothetical protein